MKSGLLAADPGAGAMTVTLRHPLVRSAMLPGCPLVRTDAEPTMALADAFAAIGDVNRAVMCVLLTRRLASSRAGGYANSSGSRSTGVCGVRP